MRVNARLDDSYTEKLEFLKQAKGLTLSDVVRESVDRYYAQVRQEADGRQAELDGLVGAFDGLPETPVDLAAEYKRYLWSDPAKARDGA
jgi:hypothetical protein